MKLRIVFLLTVLFFMLVCSSNLLAQPTTQEEFNYLTKGYKVQIEDGLDMKKGYSIVSLGEWTLMAGSERRDVSFKGLYRDGQAKPCAILMLYHRADMTNGRKDYICIPSPDAPTAIWNQTLNFVNGLGIDEVQMDRAIIWALLHFAAKEAQK